MRTTSILVPLGRRGIQDTTLQQDTAIHQVIVISHNVNLHSLGSWGFAEPRNIKLVIRRLKSVNVLDVGSEEPSMTKTGELGGVGGGGSSNTITQGCNSQ